MRNDKVMEILLTPHLATVIDVVACMKAFR